MNTHYFIRDSDVLGFNFLIPNSLLLFSYRENILYRDTKLYKHTRNGNNGAPIIGITTWDHTKCCLMSRSNTQQSAQ